MGIFGYSSKCAICGTTEGKVFVATKKGKGVCDDCLKELNENYEKNMKSLGKFVGAMQKGEKAFKEEYGKPE